jgi:hypothetical protein
MYTIKPTAYDYACGSTWVYDSENIHGSLWKDGPAYLWAVSTRYGPGTLSKFMGAGDNLKLVTKQFKNALKNARMSLKKYKGEKI